MSLAEALYVCMSSCFVPTSRSWSPPHNLAFRGHFPNYFSCLWFCYVTDGGIFSTTKWITWLPAKSCHCNTKQGYSYKTLHITVEALKLISVDLCLFLCIYCYIYKISRSRKYWKGQTKSCPFSESHGKQLWTLYLLHIALKSIVVSVYVFLRGIHECTVCINLYWFLQT
jgi:hypothetical protein